MYENVILATSWHLFLHDCSIPDSGVAKGGPGWARAHPNIKICNVKIYITGICCVSPGKFEAWPPERQKIAFAPCTFFKRRISLDHVIDAHLS